MLKKNKLLLLFFPFVLSIATFAWVKIHPWLKPSVSYERLEYLLDIGDWENANAETKNLLLRLSRRNFLQLYYIKPSLYSFSNIPCQDLQTIDELWSQHSNGKFGLAIKSKIWHERMQSANWDSYRQDAVYEDLREGYYIFKKTIKGTQDISAIPPGKLPSQDWLWSATADGLDPVPTAKNFYSRVKDCIDK